MTLIEFECRGERFALPLDCMRRVVASARPSPLPGTSDIVLGMLNVAGEVVTIVDFCRRAGFASAPIVPSQQLMILDARGFLLGFMVDRVLGVTEREPDPVPGMAEKIAVAGFVEGITRLEDGLCLIVDPEQFLLAQEKILLAQALERAGHG